MTQMQSLTSFVGVSSRFVNRANSVAPNWSFNADATTGHAFGIIMACSGALRASRSGAG